MKNAMIILAVILSIALSGILAFNSSNQPSNNTEGITSSSCPCNCR